MATHGHAEPPHYLRPTSSTLLVYTLEGEANYFDETGLSTILREGSMVWTSQGVNQSYGPREGSRWSEFFLWLNGPIFDLWQESGVPGDRSRHLTLLPVDYWLERFRQIVEVSDTASPTTRLFHLQSLLAEALHSDQKRGSGEQDQLWCDKACRLIEGGTLTEPSLESIAEALHLSYSRFRKRFRQQVGVTPGEYRFTHIQRQISQLLIESDLPIGTIAVQFGFHDPFHLSRRFKAATGLSPSEFRLKTRGVHANNP
ncbi:MAG: helix-turn-helix transcriptional regulator [Planctomycetota bacterium]